MAPDKAQVDMVLQEVYQRRGVLSESSNRKEIGIMSCAHCTVPLAELEGFSKNVRIITSGQASLHIELAGYQDLDEHLEKEVIRQHGHVSHGG